MVGKAQQFLQKLTNSHRDGGPLTFRHIVPFALMMRLLNRDVLRLNGSLRDLLWIPRKPLRSTARVDERSVLGSGDMDFVAELGGLLRARKKFWLLPMIVVFAIVGALL